MNSTPGFYAILPAFIRYDEGLTSTDKLFYAEISALTEAEGYCYAKNQYFIDLFGISERGVQKILKKLASKGYIKIEIEKNVRRIFMLSQTSKSEEKTEDIPRTVVHPTPNCSSLTPELEFAPHNNNIYNNIYKYIKGKNGEVIENVKITEAEYEKLVSKLGQDGADRAIEILDNYKGSSGKTYKSDYRAILTWVVDKLNAEKKYTAPKAPAAVQKTYSAEIDPDIEARKRKLRLNYDTGTIVQP